MNYKKHIVLLSIIFLAVFTFFVSLTYSMFTASAGSTDKFSVSSAKFDIELNVSSLYNGSYLIPMRDVYVERAVSSSQCRDERGYNVCHAYVITLSNTTNSGQVERLLGEINFDISNLSNLKYSVIDYDMLLLNNYSVFYDYIDVNSSDSIIGVSSNFTYPLGDFVELEQGESKRLLLVIWLSDNGNAQDDEFNGNFGATVTYSSVRGFDLSVDITGVID